MAKKFLFDHAVRLARDMYKSCLKSTHESNFISLQILKKLSSINKMSFAKRILYSPFFQRILWRNRPPFAGWHSWDPHPWKHPWLTPQNLSAMREYSTQVREQIKKRVEGLNFKESHFGFLGNMGNSLYLRAVPLRQSGAKITMFIHPQDYYIMSDPSWEHFNGILSGEETDIRKLRESGVPLEKIAGVEYPMEVSCAEYKTLRSKPDFLSLTSFLRYKDYRSSIPILQTLQKMDALFCTQFPYLGYLSGRPYMAAQIGGDIWLEASRGDTLGILQRVGFANANVFLASNPWTFSHARRFGFQHSIYLPLILDQDEYSPGRGNTRAEWEAKSGGTFFVLTTSRLDEEYKGSTIALEGIASFLHKYPMARMVISNWGKSKEQGKEKFEKYGLADKIIWLPLSGKKRVRDYLRSADCFLDQFVLGYFGAAGLEAMACGLPVIGRLESAQYNALCETGAPPILNAETPQDVFIHLSSLFSNDVKRKTLAAETRKWFVDNHGSERWLAEYQSMLMFTALKMKLNFKDSPLSQPLHSSENEYHREGLLNAPVFPNYSPLKATKIEGG